jgi:hypothetical protein
MFIRAATALAAALVFVSAAHADNSYTVLTPTAEPYQRFTNFVAPGSFQDTFNFSVTEASDSYIWLFPRQDAWLGFDKVENTSDVTLTLVNNDTEKEWTGVLYPQVKGTVPIFTPGVLALVANGFDPNKSLYVETPLTPGHYSAFVSGLATGSAGSSYIAKFSVSTIAVPEAGSGLLMTLGLVGVVATMRRRLTPV